MRDSREQVFDFFADATNLNLLTPPWLHFSILTPLPIDIAMGTRISHRIKLRGLPVQWVNENTEWEPPFRFTVTQVGGRIRNGCTIICSRKQGKAHWL